MSRTSRVRVLALAAVLSGAAGLTTGVGPATAADGCSEAVRGDVNGDGYAEVAVSDGNRAGAGTVHLLYGQPGGLVVDGQGTALDDQHLSQDTAGVPGTGEPDDGFGASPVLADFDDDGCADLAVGVPGEDDGRGRVVVFRGSPAGLRTTGVQTFGETDLLGVGAARSEEDFGGSLAAGDFDGDGLLDLAVGASGERVDGRAWAGGVVVLYGAPGGLVSSRTATLLTQGSAGVAGSPELGDRFGTALAVGDLDGRGPVDLAVGVPGENTYGTVTVLPGTAATGLGAAGGSSISPSTVGVPGAGEGDDAFGAALAAGDVDGDGTDDLAIGVPGENSDLEREQFGEGAVVVVPGKAGGPTGRGSEVWAQSSPGVGGVPGPSDGFGSSLALARLDGDRYADLAVGAPADRVGPVEFAGSVTLLRGGAGGLTTAGSGGTRFTEASDGILDQPEPLDFFGFSLAASLVQSADRATLVVGAPLEPVGDEQVGVAYQLGSTASGPTGAGSRVFSFDTPGLKGRAGGGFGTYLG